MKTCFVFQLSSDQMDALREKLTHSGWEISSAPYCRFKAAKPKISVAAYESGKLVVQGALAQEFVEFTLEPEIVGPGQGAAQTEHELLAFEHPHAGIDESGKGDFFGPLAVACVFVESKSAADDLERLGVKDSKLIKSDAKIAELAPKIAAAVHGKYGVVVVGPEAYNRLYRSFGNLNRLLAWEHARALENMLEKAPECRSAISDQFANKRLVLDALMKNGRNIRLEQFTKGERDVAVAAASILARAEFVRKLKALEESTGAVLPKGAGPQTLEAAKRLFLAGGEELLGKTAKMHFRTARIAMGLPPDDGQERHGAFPHFGD